VLITTAEAARRLGVSRERLRQMLEDGMLAGFRIEAQARARYVDLDGQGSENDRVLVSIQEAARRYGMSTSTIRRLRLDAWSRFALRATGVSTSLWIRVPRCKPSKATAIGSGIVCWTGQSIESERKVASKGLR
jgi:excisionase family DNA binding protein